jgi:hypothetical protein
MDVMGRVARFGEFSFFGQFLTFGSFFEKLIEAVGLGHLGKWATSYPIKFYIIVYFLLVCE